MIRTLLVTHAELDVQIPYFKANPAHGLGVGLDQVKKLISCTIQYIENDRKSGGLTLLLMGEGSRYEDCFLEFLKQAASKFPKVRGILFPFLGGPTAIRSKEGKAYSCRGTEFRLEDYFPLRRYVPPEIVWQAIKEVDEIANQAEANSYSVFCGGRQFLKMLKEEDEFEIASVYALDWRKKKVKCIIRNGELVVLP